MIIVKNRELLIPNNERYIGTTYDNDTENRVFQVPRFSQRGVDLANLTFRLDIQYANEAFDTVVLGKEVGEAFIILVWRITSAALQVPGTLYIGLRAIDDEATVKWSSFSAAMYAERHLNTPGNYGGSLTEIEQMEQDHVYMKSVVDELKSNLDYAHDAEAWAKGTRSGSTVPSTDDTYHNNSKYYSEQANTKATQAANSATAAANSATQAAETVTDTNTRFNNAMAAVTSDTEVIDARVGADGTTYPVLKTRLDTEHTQLKSALDNVLATNGAYESQSINVIENSYVYATEGSQYNGVVNSSNLYGYAVIPVKPNDIISVSGRASANAPICVYLNNSTPSRNSYVGCYEFVSGNTTYIDQKIAIPYGVSYVAVNTINTGTFPISIKKFAATEKVNQLWEAGYIDLGDMEDFMSVDGSFTQVSVTPITGKNVYASTNTPQYNGAVNNTSSGAYVVLPVRQNDIIRVSCRCSSAYAGVVWLNANTPSIQTFVGAFEFLTGNTFYSKRSVSVPAGVSYAAINTIDNSAYPITVEKYSSTKSVANLYEAYTVNNFAEPLHVLRDDTGMLDLFLNVGCIGDSLASGESASNNGGTVEYHDIYKYSWGQFLARKTGNTYYNFSEGGLTTKTWLASEYATQCFDGNHNCQAYIIGLGQNDRNVGMSIGTSADINMSDYTQNADTFYGNYGKIIQKLQEQVPKAKIFIITDFAPTMETMGYNSAIRTIATLFNNVYLLDFYTFGQDVYDMLRKVARSGHFGAYGYKVSAMAIATYINWIVQNNVSDFGQVEFIDTEWSWTE